MPFQCNSCSLDPYPEILTNEEAEYAEYAEYIKPMTDLCVGLGYNVRVRNSPGSFINVVKSYPQRFTSSYGLLGCQLLDWENRTHRESLAEMAHAFLCTNGNGPLYWPHGHVDNDNDLLDYSEHSTEIYEDVIQLFYKVNQHIEGKRRVLSQPQHPRVVDVLRHHGDRHDDPIDVDSLMETDFPSEDKTPIDPRLLQDRQVVAEDMDFELALEEGHEASTSVPPESGAIHPTESPDHLDVNDPSQPPCIFRTSAQTRRVKRRREERGSMPEFIDYRSATPGPSHQRQTDRDAGPEAVPNPLVNSTTQANDRPEQVDHHRLGSEYPSTPMDTGSSADEPDHTPSQEDNYDNRRLEPRPEIPNSSQQTQNSSTQESGTQTDATALPPAPEAEPEHQPRPLKAPTPGPTHQVDLIFSVDVAAGLNLRWNPRGEFFQYTLEQLLQEMSPYWNKNFHSLLVFLETPGRLIVEVVHRAEEKEFRIALTRFAQKLAALGFWHGGWDRHVILEIRLQQVAKGEDLHERLQRLIDRATKEDRAAL
ncbi:hypothetical protein NM208_g7249 [Fusarium decemcellulare]|uniref:Uncharacterized protein n=1 Tax=Fusarium decemcellulare TaxID=57161 RepID=A0ACC1SA10_9HYPO|nr:hypothetical protein NM208_g7249 [Fusarium decemcellulare]